MIECEPAGEDCFALGGTVASLIMPLFAYDAGREKGFFGCNDRRDWMAGLRLLNGEQSRLEP
jgi:hypothetical protein